MDHPRRLRLCRPALNYYLLCAWPGEYRDDKQSRFINERAHANIQKDGTYSVVPRMWGGVTTAGRAARHRRRGRQVRHPDGQGHRRPAHRPAGRKKDDLPAVWADLNAAAWSPATPTPRPCAR